MRDVCVLEDSGDSWNPQCSVNNLHVYYVINLGPKFSKDFRVYLCYLLFRFKTLVFN